MVTNGYCRERMPTKPAARIASFVSLNVGIRHAHSSSKAATESRCRCVSGSSGPKTSLMYTVPPGPEDPGRLPKEGCPAGGVAGDLKGRERHRTIRRETVGGEIGHMHPHSVGEYGFRYLLSSQLRLDL